MMKNHVRAASLALSLLLAIGGLVGCEIGGTTETETNEHRGEDTKPNAPYVLDYESNGNGTCSVLIRTNSANTPENLFDIVVPETSPDGERVTGMVNTLHESGNVPAYIEAGDFDRYIRQPLEAYYGVEEENRPSYDDESYGKHFYLLRALSYYQLIDLDQCTSAQSREEMLAKYPFLEHMDAYVLDHSASFAEKEMLSCQLSEAGITAAYIEAANKHFLELAGDAAQSTIEVNGEPVLVELKDEYVPLEINPTDGIRSITLPDAIQKVEIPSCRQLTSLQLPASATEIHLGGGLVEVLEIPDGVKTLSIKGFSNVKEFTVRAGVDSAEIVMEKLEKITFEEDFRGVAEIWVGTPSLTISGGETAEQIVVMGGRLDETKYAEGVKEINIRHPGVHHLSVPNSVERINAGIVTDIHGYRDEQTGEMRWNPDITRLDEIVYNGTIEQWEQIKVFYDYEKLLKDHEKLLEGVEAEKIDPLPSIDIEWTVLCTDGRYVATYHLEPPKAAE